MPDLAKDTINTKDLVPIDQKQIRSILNKFHLGSDPKNVLPANHLLSKGLISPELFNSVSSKSKDPKVVLEAINSNVKKMLIGSAT